MSIIPAAEAHPDPRIQTLVLVQTAAQACEDKKGADTRILALDAADSGLADFFLITSATSDRQALTIADEIELRIKREYGTYPHSVEGRRQGEWILLDYIDFVVHVFLVEKRAFYDIERLRKSARPFTPEEFDAELKAALSEKTRAARAKSTKTTAGPAAKKAPAKKTPAKKAAKKAAAKPAKKAPAKKAAKKSAAKKAVKKK
jgi:ribosome-associated protein